MWVIIKHRIEVRKDPLPDLHTINKIINGYAEPIWQWRLSTGNVAQLYANEEGKLMGNPASFYLHEVRDVILGTTVVVGINSKGEHTQLSLDETNRFSLMKTAIGVPALIVDGVKR